MKDDNLSTWQSFIRKQHSSFTLYSVAFDYNVYASHFC